VQSVPVLPQARSTKGLYTGMVIILSKAFPVCVRYFRKAFRLLENSLHFKYKITLLQDKIMLFFLLFIYLVFACFG
jgi:hypothetical protein